MIIFDIRFGPFDLLIERDARSVPFEVTREGPGEVFLDAGRYALTFTNHRKVT